MNPFELSVTALGLLPCFFMLLGSALVPARQKQERSAWSAFIWLSSFATLFALASLGLQLTQSAGPAAATTPGWGVAFGLSAAWVALLVQALGTVIGSFSSRYLQGEPGQAGYIRALAAVLAAVQLLVIADHWVLLIGAWAATGVALQRLLCFYADRPFAVLAAHKKFLADRLADVLLVAAAIGSSLETGSGSISEQLSFVQQHGASLTLQLCAVALVLAVAIRTALLPLHGWLIQVMEAPTPVSALLHAGVVNLGGYVLIRFAPLLEAVPVARWLLVGLGLFSAIAAGFVMLTRISIKVRLAWSTLAQMGFMVLECGLGLYQLALLHLLGHSLYKAHAFLSAGTIVSATHTRSLRGDNRPTTWSLVLAPVLSVAATGAIMAALDASGAAQSWPWWWSMLLAFAWAPVFWCRTGAVAAGAHVYSIGTGVLLTTALFALAWVAHWLPLGVSNSAHDAFGWMALAGMALVYVGSAALQMPACQQVLEPLRRQSYAGFYLDEVYTRFALQVWPVKLPSMHRRSASTVAEPGVLASSHASS
jgi:NAD(P)H-quinone oxidoreductase subunit 5